MRRYEITLAETVRRYERVVLDTNADLETMLDNAGDDVVPAAVLVLLGEGDVVSSDYGPADEPDYGIAIEDVEDLDKPSPEPLAVPYPPTTAEQAEAWVRWAETEIGVGWHPDTKGSDLETFSAIGLEAVCACGETFNPGDIHDIIHLQRGDGEECGLYGTITNSWGTSAPLFADPDVCARYDAGLEAAHELLPDVYRTSAEMFAKVHPNFPNEQKGA